MIIKLLSFLGWRGGVCVRCGYCHAAHFNHNIQWHPDFSPCNKFKEQGQCK